MWELHGSFEPEGPQDDKGVRGDSSGLKPDRNDKTLSSAGSLRLTCQAPRAYSVQRRAQSLQRYSNF